MPDILEWTEWHLTPRGWTRGTSQTIEGRQSLPSPRDRVKTSVYHVHGNGEDAAQTTRLDEKVIFDAAAARALEREFGPCPCEL